MERLGRAIGRARVNIAMMRTFVQLRRLMDTNRDLARKIEALEKKYDEQYNVRGRRWMSLTSPCSRITNHSSLITSSVRLPITVD